MPPCPRPAGTLAVTGVAVLSGWGRVLGEEVVQVQPSWGTWGPALTPSVASIQRWPWWWGWGESRHGGVSGTVLASKYVPCVCASISPICPGACRSGCHLGGRAWGPLRAGGPPSLAQEEERECASFGSSRGPLLRSPRWDSPWEAVDVTGSESSAVPGLGLAFTEALGAPSAARALRWSAWNSGEPRSKHGSTF